MTLNSLAIRRPLAGEGVASRPRCWQKDAAWQSNRSCFVNITIGKGEAVPFGVLEPTLRKAASSFKAPKTRNLSLLANKVHKRQCRGERYEQTTLYQDNGLWRVSETARRISERPGNLERASCRDL